MVKVLFRKVKYRHDIACQTFNCVFTFVKVLYSITVGVFVRDTMQFFNCSSTCLCLVLVFIFAVVLVCDIIVIIACCCKQNMLAVVIAVCRHVNTSHQLIIDQLFEREAVTLKELFSQYSSAPLYPPATFQVDILMSWFVYRIIPVVRVCILATCVTLVRQECQAVMY